MTMRTSTVAAAPAVARPGGAHILAFGAPLAAVLAGLAAEFLDFRALRVPLLLMVLAGVAATAYALSPRGWRGAAFTVALGALTWAAAETIYVIIHAASGQPLETERSASQPAAALWLIAVHGVVLGVPTGAAAACLQALLPRGRRARA
jgi:hypothetical protein